MKIKLLRERRAKIVATLGPSSDSEETIEELIRSGLDIVRLNMSHGDHHYHKNLFDRVRKVSAHLSREVGILADLQGPKIRVDKLKQPIELEPDDEWLIVYCDDIETISKKFPEYAKKIIPTTYEGLVGDAVVGARILFDDGLMEGKVIEKGECFVKICVLVGGLLKSNKGINLPDISVSAPSLTEKDREDLYFALKLGVDFVALSFVRSEQDILDLKIILHGLKSEVPIIAKIEKPEAIDNIDAIIHATDAIMVARGDMGVEVGNHLVPSIQKNIIRKCNDQGVPVITATQMLESMITNSRPTRAEASDVANAIWDGTDAVMLSGETASGAYPVEALRMMNDIIKEAELRPKERAPLRTVQISSVTSANQVAAAIIAEKVNARMILCLTERGRSCLHMSRYRPKSPVLGVTSNISSVRIMNLYWGITPYYFISETENAITRDTEIIEDLREKSHIAHSDKVVITHGDGKYFQKGTSNSIRVEIVKDLDRMIDLTRSVSGQEKIEKCETQNAKFILDTETCALCQRCIEICPADIWISKDDDSRATIIDKVQAEKCVFDMQCVTSCPTGSIEIIKK